MNTDDIIDAFNEIEATSIKNAREPKKKISRKTLWISAGAAAAACLLVALQLPHMLRQIHHDGSCDCPDHQITPTPAVGANHWNYKSFGLVTRDSMINFGWDCQTIAKQFPFVTYNDTEYYLRRSYYDEDMKVSASLIGEKLTNYTAEVCEYKTDITHTMECTLYEIAGVDPARFLAVQYAGEENADDYYVFHQNEFNPPATLGEFISSLNLTETLPLTEFSHSTYDYSTRERNSESYGLSLEDSKVVWDMISAYASAGTRTNEEHGYENNRITFSATSEALGLYNRSFALVADGYLSTNIDDYGYDYYLGEEAVAEIREYILAHKTEPRKDSIASIYGVVTEIGEDYLKFDDTILMKNPENGLTFTVYVQDNTTVKSYLMSGQLEIGDHIEILHRGISPDEPTIIRTAFHLVSGRFVFEEDESVEDNPSGPTPTPVPRTPRSH